MRTTLLYLHEWNFKDGGTREKRWLPFLTSIFIVVSPQCLCSEDSMRIPVFVVRTLQKETTYKICKFKVFGKTRLDSTFGNEQH